MIDSNGLKQFLHDGLDVQLESGAVRASMPEFAFVSARGRHLDKKEPITLDSPRAAIGQNFLTIELSLDDNGKILYGILSGST